MTERPQQFDDEDSGAPLGGGRLAIARRENDISARDIAKELHLDEPTVRALEQNDFEMLGAPVFAKGHLRKYAEIVGVPIEEILADYYKLTRASGAPPVVGRPRKIDSSISPGPWIAAAIVLIVAAAAAFWWYTRVPATASAQPDTAALARFASDPVEEPLQDSPNDSPAEAVATQPATVTEELAAPALAATSFEPAAVGSPPPLVEVILLPQVRVELSYSGDCWTEVSDAAGRRLFYDLGTLGRVVAVSGDEPLHIVLGDSSNVSITVDGRDYPIPRPTRNGSLTRLTVSSQ